MFYTKIYKILILEFDMLFQFITTIIFFIGNLVRTAETLETRPAKPNPAKEEEEGASPCKIYNIRIADEYKPLKGQKPYDTEVYKEAKANGLVPIQVVTIFASPNAVDLGRKLPDSMKKVFLVVQEGNKNNVAYEEGQTYSFVGGDIVDALEKSENGDKDKDKEKEEKPEKEDKEAENAKGEEPAADAGAKESKGTPKASASQMKLRSPKLMAKPSQARTLSLREPEEVSDNLMMPKDE